ncbi:hypothetical protein GGF41_007298, partial [Coemansia sp. RSA 2531]
MYKSRKRSASPTSRRALTSRRYGDESRSTERSRRSRAESDHYKPDSQSRHRRELDSKSDKDYPKDKGQAPVPAGTIQVTFDDRSGKKVTLPCL